MSKMMTMKGLKSLIQAMKKQAVIPHVDANGHEYYWPFPALDPDKEAKELVPKEREELLASTAPNEEKEGPKRL